MLFISYLLLGIITGTLAGLLGIGGGLIIVPTLALLFSFQQFNPEISTHLAIGTSLACMIFTTGSATVTHFYKKAISWPVLFFMTIGIICGSFAGGLITNSLNGKWLKIFLGCFAWGMAIKMFKERHVTSTTGKMPAKPFLILFGVLSSCISTMLGIGGAIFNVPAFCRFGLTIQHAVATASACSLPVAVIGTLTSIFVEKSTISFPEYTKGYVYWPAFLGIIIGSIPCARIGAILAHRLPKQYIRIPFAILLIIVGGELILSS
ncbi:MAG: sulfite exporter TauE/SafE family protein [Endozoicomonadaceae bacterium]|nr:sulfite exporter TauE/SafE family protein [Endozoicomonadaceae bacterium]